MKNKKKQNKPPRNWLAVHAHFRTGAGHHGDHKKETSRRACRGKVKWEEGRC